MTMNNLQSQHDLDTSCDIAGALKEIVVEVLELDFAPDQITDDTNLFDLGIDSLAVVRMLTVIENRFGIDFPEAAIDAAMFERFGNLVDAIATCA